VLTDLAAAALALACGATAAGPAERNAQAVRIASVESDVCTSLCPPVPAQATSEWLRSLEGRRANGCPMACRMEQPAAALYRKACDLATAKNLDGDSPLVKALGREGVQLVRRLRFAMAEAEGKRLGPLCARARSSLPGSDEARYLECTGRVVRPEAPDALAQPDPGRALRCAALFAERDLDWLTRCPPLEAKTDVGACVEEAGLAGRSHRRSAAESRERCEGDAVERLASVFRQGRRSSR
jgi:hypothetical protein